MNKEAIQKEVEDKARFYIGYFEKNKRDIPNIDRLIKLLESNKNPGHIIHAEFVKRFFEGNQFKIADVEKKYDDYDVDIELDSKVNLQIWHGASVSTHNIIKRKVSKLGGVKTDWNKDEEVIKKKLNQLPDNEFGLLICYNYHIGINVLPEWEDDIPNNKAIATLYHINYGDGPQGEARLYHSDDFKYSELTKAVLSELGFIIKM